MQSHPSQEYDEHDADDEARQCDEHERLRAIGISNAWLGRSTGRRWRGNHPEQALLLFSPHTLYGAKWTAVWFAPDGANSTDGTPTATYSGSTWAIALYAALNDLLSNAIEARFYAFRERGRHHADWIEAE